MTLPWSYIAYLSLLLLFGIYYGNGYILILWVVSFVLACLRYRSWRVTLVLGLGVYFVWVTQEHQAQTRQVHQSPSQLTPKMDTLKVDGDYLSFKAVASGRQYQVFYRLKSAKEQAFFEHLAQPITLEVVANLSKPSPRRNFDGFDYQAYLATQNIYDQLNIEQITAIKPQSQASSPSLWRRQLLVRLKRGLSEPLYYYTSALLFGERDPGFDKQLKVYQKLGLAHLFALSGMHVSFFVGGLTRLLYRLGISRSIQLGCQIVFSICYWMLTGWAVSVFRALLQSLLGRLGVKGLDNLGMTLLTVLLLMPKGMLGIGGQLSFAFAFWLSLQDGEFPDQAKTSMSWVKRCWHRLKQHVMLNLGTLPLLLWHFYSVQPMALMLTLVMGVVFERFLMPLILVTGVLSLSVQAALPGTKLVLHLLECLLKASADLFPVPFVIGKPSLIVLLGFIFCLALMTHNKLKQQPYIWFGVMVILMLVVKYPINPSVTMVDVGQGDSILIQGGLGQKTVLIDTGGRVEVGPKSSWQTRKKQEEQAQNTLIPYLKARGISRIDTLVLTHADQDHMGDMLAVSQAIHVKSVWVTPGFLTKKGMKQALKKMQVPVHIVQKGERLVAADGRLQVLAPDQVGDGSNNDSLVLYGRLLGKRWLLTGDLEAEGEDQLITAYPRLAVDILKVGHHGSKTSTTQALLDHTKPKLALISAGLNNRYGHPHRQTLTRLDEAGVAVLRTDQKGAIRLTKTSGGIRIQTVLK